MLRNSQGSESTIEGTKLFEEFLKVVKENKWDYVLPEKAHLLYKLPVIDDDKLSVIPKDSPFKKILATIPRNHHLVRNILQNAEIS